MWRRTKRPPPTRTTTNAEQRRPVSVAITGGIGAGKSEMLRSFARHGAAVISSDEIVHELLRGDAEVKHSLVERWGERILGPDGVVDRARIAEIVFADEAELAWLEALLHPRVTARYLSWREELTQRDDPPRVCVTEVPLLFEVGADERFDVVVAVTASPEVRVKREIRAMDGRERRLMPDSVKLARADYAFVNDGTLQELDAFVSDLMAKLAR